MATPPSILNYYVGRGNVYMAAVDSTSWAHVGNCPKFSITPKHELLQYKRAVGGVKVTDTTFLASREAQVSIDADEFTAETLAAALGAADAGGGVYRVGTAIVERAVKFVGSNDKGPKCQIILPRVLFVTDSETEFIGQDYMNIQLRGTASYWPKTAAGSDYTFADLTFI